MSLSEYLTNLYSNIGNKIKGLAVGFFLVEAIGCIVYSIFGFFQLLAIAFDGEPEYIFLSLLMPVCCIVAIFVAYVITCPLYAFGELVQNSTDLKNQVAPSPTPVNNTPTTHDSEPIVREAPPTAEPKQPFKFKEFISTYLKPTLLLLVALGTLFLIGGMAFGLF